MIRLLFASLLSLSTTVCFAEVPRAMYSVGVCQAGATTRLTSVKVGQTFDLVFYAQDLRPNGTWYGEKTVNGSQVTGTWPLVRGMFACYADVIYDKELARISGAYDGMSSSQFRNLFWFRNGYNYGPPQAFDAEDRIDNIGAFTFHTGINTAPVEIWRVRMLAKKAGALVFTPDVSELQSPKTDTLVYGNTNEAVSPPDPSLVPPSQIVLISCAVTVQP